MLKYIVMVFILVMSAYSFSFAKYNWNMKNRKAAVGVVLLTATMIVLPAVLMFFR